MAFDQIGDATIKPTELSREERAVILVLHCGGIIGNGGFEYLFSGDFEGDEDYRLTAEAFRDVGLTRCYECFQEAFALFPNGEVPPEASVRHPLFTKVDMEIRNRIDDKFYGGDTGDERRKAVAAYIRKHAVALDRTARERRSAKKQ